MQYGTFEAGSFPSKPRKLLFGITFSLLGALLLLLVIFRQSYSSEESQSLWRGSIQLLDTTDLSKWKLIWADEFDGGHLNQTTWHLETINGQQSGNNELEIYTTHPKNSPVSDGQLRITAHKERIGDWRFTSARMTTQNSFAFTYGRVVARFKNPKGKGLWPAIWMLGSSIPTIPWPDCGEVDIMEMVGGPSWPGGGDDRVVGTAHWLGKVRTKQRRHKWINIPGAVYEGGSITTSEVRRKASGPLHDNFHVVAMEWNQSHFVWYLDDVMFMQKRIDDPTDPGLKAFHKPFFLLLNLAVGGNWPGQPDRHSLARFPHEFQLDYIRVYQQQL